MSVRALCQTLLLISSPRNIARFGWLPTCRHNLPLLRPSTTTTLHHRQRFHHSTSLLPIFFRFLSLFAFPLTSAGICTVILLDTEDMVSLHNTGVPAIRGPTSESVYSQECFQKYKDFHYGTGAFKSPGSTDKSVAIKISKRDFFDFKKLWYRYCERKGK